MTYFRYQSTDLPSPVWRTPVVTIHHPSSISTVKITPVKVTEDHLEPRFSNLFDGQVIAVLGICPQLDGVEIRVLTNKSTIVIDLLYNQSLLDN